MVIVVLQKSVTREDLEKAREEHKDYIKITADISQNIVAIGGEYHADAEKILLEEYGSKQKDIWGGGYNISTKKFETMAIINIRQNPENQSMEIINPEIRKKFLDTIKEKLKKLHLLV